MLCLVTGRFSPILPPEPTVILTAHASKFQTAALSVLCVMFKVHSLVRESIEFFPGMAYKFFFQTSVTVPVAPIFTGKITNFMFRTWCTSIHIFLCYYHCIVIIIVTYGRLTKNCKRNIIL
jgi:hypothetical protein